MKILSIFLGCMLIAFRLAAGTYTVFEENGKVGLKDAQGKVLIPAEYEALGWSNGAFSVVENVTGYRTAHRWGLISLDNKRITGNDYEELIPGEGALFAARKKSTVSLRLVAGCINASGKEVIPFLYDGIKVASLRAIVFTKIGNLYKYGLIDLKNETLIPQQYQEIKPMGSLRYAVRNFEGKTALFTDAGKQITGFTIDSLSVFKKDYAIIYQGIQQGLVDRDGRIKIEPRYREVMITDDGAVRMREPDDWLFLDGQNKQLLQLKADSVSGIGKDLLKITNASVIRLTNHQLAPVTPTTFSYIGKFEKGKAIYQWGDYKGVILRDGTVLLPAVYHDLFIDQNFILANQRVSGKDSWMLLDSLGTKRSDKTYERIEPFNGKFFAVRQRGFWGALNYIGQQVIHCSYDSLMQGRDSLVVVKFRGQYGIINFREEWVVAPQANKLHLIGKDRYVAIKGPTTYLKSVGGNTIYFSDNRLEAHADYLLEYLPSGTIWRIDMQGVIVDRQVFPEEATEKVFEEAEGFRAIKRNGKYGFIDAQGRLRIANRYEAAQPFSEGMAPVKILGKWGFINRWDNIAVQPVYEEVFAFKDGYAVVKQKGLYGLIDKNGKLMLPVRYTLIEHLPTKTFRITQDGLVGLAAGTGRTIINPKYNSVEDLGNGYIIVSRGGKYGVINTQGVSTIPLMYDYVDYDVYNHNFLAMKKATWLTQP